MPYVFQICKYVFDIYKVHVRRYVLTRQQNIDAKAIICKSTLYITKTLFGQLFPYCKETGTSNKARFIILINMIDQDSFFLNY